MLGRSIRQFCSQVLSNGEKKLADILRSKISGVSDVIVNDISNGCGSMYSITVEASSFKGLGKVAQHRLVTDALKEDIKNMHGLLIKTIAK